VNNSIQEFALNLFLQEDSILIDEMMGVLKETVKSATVLLLVLDGGVDRFELDFS
jgi:hypothetical protein